MNIKIYSNTKIYAVAPANTATGGPELLHQLIFHLRNDLNIEAYMYYTPSDIPNPVHTEYKEYNNPYVKRIEDKKENLLIVPELIGAIKLLSKYSKIRKVIWWLSVDNFYLSAIFSSKSNFLFKRVINRISNSLFDKILFNMDELALKKMNRLRLSNFYQVKQANFHLVQSHYAMNHLKNNDIPKIKIFYLSDYLNKNFLTIHTDLQKKENIVVYNPKKSFSFTKKIIKKALDIKFVPLINMTRQQVIETLQRAKVYIDFGNHPGKDRVPREAAILKCCVITGMRGSAKYFEDVPIPKEYKFEEREKNVDEIIKKIKDSFENFKIKYKDFDYYRESIKSEPEKFINDLKKIFIKVM